MSAQLFHFEYQGETGWESLGSGSGDDGDQDATGAAFDDLRALHGGAMPFGSYRYIKAKGEDARWREFELGLDGISGGATGSRRPLRPLADREAAHIAKALTHPLRLSFLRALRRGRRISPVEFSRESGELLGNVSHHVKALRRAGVVQVVETSRSRSGARNRYAMGGPRAAAVTAMLDVLEGLEADPGNLAGPSSDGGVERGDSKSRAK